MSILIINISLIFDPISANYNLSDRLLLIFNLFGGLFTNNTLFSAAIIIITTLLAGINIALLVYKLRKVKILGYKESGTSTTGTVASVMASGCSSCGISILSLIGVTGGLAFLPFGGFELGFLGIILLLLSIYWTSKGISNYGICKT